jgi:hypothetical protein
VRPTLGTEPAAEEANPVGYLSGDTGIGLATFSYKLLMSRCLQTVRHFTFNCLICPATAPFNYVRRFPPDLSGRGIGQWASPLVR